MIPTGRPALGGRQRHVRVLSEIEQAMLRAFTRWYESYRLSPLRDVNLVEAFKGGWTAGREVQL